MKYQTMIVPSYARKETMKALLENNEQVFGKEVLSLNAYKSSLLNAELNYQEEEAALFAAVTQHISPDNIYYAQLRYPLFFAYFYDFANILARNGISSDELPQDRTQETRDKNEILKYLLDQDLISKRLSASLDQIEDASDIEIADYFYPQLADKKDIEKLIRKGAKRTMNTVEKNTVFSCFVANNTVREVISLAQYLIRQKNERQDMSDYVIMVNDKNTYLPIIQRIFNYYQIPYEMNVEEENREAVRFACFLQLIRNQDIRSFLQAYHHKVFNDVSYLLIEYIRYFDLSYAQILQPFDRAEKLLADKNQKEYIDSTFTYGKLNDLARQEALCEKAMADIRELLSSSEFKKLQTASLKQQCSYAYRYLYSGSEELSKQKADEIQDIFELCRAILKAPGNEEHLAAMLDNELHQLKITRNIAYKNGIPIIEPYQNCLNKRKAIILGCSQTDYPQSIAISGFFDEDYLSEIGRFPKLVERNEYFEKEYLRLLHSFDEVIFSYAAASVDGDSYERSSFIYDLLPKNEDGEAIEETWPYAELNYYYENNDRLDPDIARKLYLDEQGYLSASPSTFEQYVGCPFRYFIEKGLHLKDEENITIAANTLGNIQHSIVEQLFKGRNIDPDQLEKELDPYFMLMKQLMPNDENMIEAMKKRLNASLAPSVAFLNDFKKHDDHDYYPEEPISDYHFKIGNYLFRINGFIDRLDIRNDQYRIIDYKSSPKSVNYDDLCKGINFQLLTYLVIYYLLIEETEGRQLEPELFAYFSLKYKTLDENDLKGGKSEEQIREETIRYHTYFLDEHTASDEQFKNAHKRGDIAFTFDRLKELTLGLYEAIAARILSGDISIRPANNACLFCKYHDICHFSGEELAKDEMDILVESGKEEDEETE